ncbi:DUF4179 domain-containing protein [Paenibacillus eucommiae]|uniref:DUF4179 domain-containing protein n=1 Tax=Paenibacillus eucommiae TaxID=1355755 RepID=A0ABS4IX38_9BACL|nr:hypothetical protein [Paenibacillus eucommiae]
MINMTKESNGIKVTVTEAIFDGETVSLTYSLESKQDLGDAPYLHAFLDIKGDWSFSFALKATKRNTQSIDLSAEYDGVLVHIGKVSVTLMSVIVYYDQMVTEKVRNKWERVDVELEIKDDFGNNYLGEGNEESVDN